jgi:NADH dehydrogenase
VDGRSLSFDHLIVATGSVVASGVAGVREHAIALNTPDDADRLRLRVAALPDGARVVVVGAGLTGIELATELAEAHPRLRIGLLGRPGGLSERGQQLVANALDALRIERPAGRVRAVHAEGLDTDQGPVRADVVAWVAGMEPSPWLAGSGLPLDDFGRLRVDGSLRVVGRPRILAAGDCAGTLLRMACATAIPMGCHAAAEVIRAHQGREPRRFAFAYVLRCVSLGRERALVQGVDAVDRPTWALGGRVATTVKETICWTVPRLPEWEAGARLPLYGWRRAHLPLPDEARA